MQHLPIFDIEPFCLVDEIEIGGHSICFSLLFLAAIIFVVVRWATENQRALE